MISPADAAPSHRCSHQGQCAPTGRVTLQWLSPPDQSGRQPQRCSAPQIGVSMTALNAATARNGPTFRIARPMMADLGGAAQALPPSPHALTAPAPCHYHVSRSDPCGSQLDRANVEVDEREAVA